LAQAGAARPAAAAAGGQRPGAAGSLSGPPLSHPRCVAALQLPACPLPIVPPIHPPKHSARTSPLLATTASAGPAALRPPTDSSPRPPTAANRRQPPPTASPGTPYCPVPQGAQPRRGQAGQCGPGHRFSDVRHAEDGARKLHAAFEPAAATGGAGQAPGAGGRGGTSPPGRLRPSRPPAVRPSGRLPAPRQERPRGAVAGPLHLEVHPRRPWGRSLSSCEPSARTLCFAAIAPRTSATARE
jgi:hypothetical protein